MICLQKRETPNIIEVIDPTVMVTTVFVVLILMILIILAVLMIYYLIKRRTITKRVKVAPAALIAAAMGKVSLFGQGTQYSQESLALYLCGVWG